VVSEGFGSFFGKKAFRAGNNARGPSLANDDHMDMNSLRSIDHSQPPDKDRQTHEPGRDILEKTGRQVARLFGNIESEVSSESRSR